MLDRTALPPPPRAERRPVASTRHGVTLTDDYAWLRADNWREVMRDPSVLDPAIRAYLEAENAYEKAALGAHGAAAGQAVRRDEGPHQGGRLLGAEPGRPARLLLPLSRRRTASDRLPPAARGRRGGDAARRRRARGRQGLLPARRDAPFARPSAVRLVGRRQGIGIRHAAHPRACDGHATLPTSLRTSKARRCGPRIHPPSITCGSTPIIARRASIAIGSASRRPTTRWSMRRRTNAISSRSGSCSPAALRKSRCTTTRPRNAG